MSYYLILFFSAIIDSMDLAEIKKQNSFQTIIMNTEKVLFEGKAKYVSSKNDTAKFDILPGHTNFISIIKEYVTLMTADDQKIDYKVDYGIIMCYENILKVYLGIKQNI